ncbi:MAG: DUF4349 domain-containing protein [Acidimicrobiales bacterium]
MTVIDDDLLASLFKNVGSSIAVPESGASDILDRAIGRSTADEGDDNQVQFDQEEDAPGIARTSRVRTLVRTHRLLSVAACLLVAVLVVGGATWNWKPTPTARVNNSSYAAPHSARSNAGATTSPSNAFGSPHASGQPTGTPAFALPSSDAAGKATSPASTTTTSPPLPSGEVGQSSKIEQTGTLSLMVAKDALNKTMTELSFLATANNGFVASTQTQTGSGSSSGTTGGSVTLQVPVASFSDVLKKAQSFGKTSSLSTKATDVTGQYVNLQAQITALQASLQQYLTIMTKATSIGDILSVQSQINTIQSQIQQLQGQLQLLTHETTYSTLTVMVNEKASPVPVMSARPQSGLAQAWHKSVHGFVDAVEWLIRIAGPALFVLLFAGAIIVVVRFGWRRYRLHSL